MKLSNTDIETIIEALRDRSVKDGDGDERAWSVWHSKVDAWLNSIYDKYNGELNDLLEDIITVAAQRDVPELRTLANLVEGWLEQEADRIISLVAPN